LQTRLSRFTGASAISSADFYDEEEEGRGVGRGGNRSNNNNNNFDIDNMNASELVGRLSIQVPPPPSPLYTTGRFLGKIYLLVNRYDHEKGMTEIVI
jgi:hypothetical protein